MWKHIIHWNSEWVCYKINANKITQFSLFFSNEDMKSQFGDFDHDGVIIFVFY